MQSLSIRDLLDMATADVDNAPERIEEMYRWHFEREMTAIKLTLGAAATLLATLVIAHFEGKIAAPRWQTIGALAGAFLTGSYGAYRYWQLRRIQRQFVAALRLYTALQRSSDFLRLYLRAVGRLP
jgi:hypothetical protein